MSINPETIKPDLKYPLKEVAQFLEISYGTTLKLRKENKLKSIKIGKKYYIKGTDVLSYIKSG